MIIDLLTQKNNQIKCSFYDFVCSTLKKNYFSIKTFDEITSWKVERSISTVSYTVSSNDISYLKDIEYNVVGQYQNLKIEYSLDYINWSELEYVVMDSVIYKKIAEQYLNLDTNEFIEYDPEMLYCFKKYNKYSREEEYLYTNHSFKFIRFTFSNVVSTTEFPLKFVSLSIFIDEEFNELYLNKAILSIRSNMFYNSRVFEDYTFFPDVIRNYMKMLETNNDIGCCSDYITTKLQKSTISIENIQL